MASDLFLGDRRHPPTKQHNHELKAAGLVHIGAIPSRGVFEIEFTHETWCDILRDGIEKGYCNCDAGVTVRPARFGMVQ